ncbi:MAG TPA: DUF6516 family protein [Stellaceae bacterium]|nr:DUF6516 family protein [Stellaceae bacterium]
MPRLLLRERHVLSESAFAEIVIWQLPRLLPGSSHRFKYRLAFVVGGECVLRFDNEAGKGNHKHIGETEAPYQFTSLTGLLTDFWSEIDGWRTR